MPRFFFHIVLNGLRLEDEEGIEFCDLANASKEAIEAGRELVAESIFERGEVDHGEFQITDEVGKQLRVIPFPSVPN
jgi:hypothetical protein